MLPFTVNTPTLSFMVKCCHLTSVTWDPVISSEIREFIYLNGSILHCHIFPTKESNHRPNVFINVLILLSH